MGWEPNIAGDCARNATPAAVKSGNARMPARRPAPAANDGVIVQIHRHDGGQASADEAGQVVVAHHFLLLIDAREAAAQSVRPLSSQISVMLDRAALAEQSPRWRQFAFTPIAADQGLAAVVRSHVTTLAEQAAGMDAAGAASMVPLTIGLIAALLRSLDARAAPQLGSLPAFHRKRIKDYVRNNLCNPLLSVEIVAEAVGLSPRYIHHLFENEPASLMQWIITKRLLHCRQLLVDKGRRHWKISQIAYDAGFNDLAHFSRSFRKHFDVSPSQARTGNPL